MYKGEGRGQCEANRSKEEAISDYARGTDNVRRGIVLEIGRKGLNENKVNESMAGAKKG